MKHNVSSYTNKGCRCDKCRKSMAVYMRAYRATQDRDEINRFRRLKYAARVKYFRRLQKDSQ